MAFCRIDTTAPWWSWQGSSALPAQNVIPQHVCLPCWRCSCLLPLPRSFFHRWGGSTWLSLLPTPPRSHQPLRAPGGSRLRLSAPPDVAPVQEAPLSCPPHYRILLPIVQAPELLGTRAAHSSDTALHNTSKASNKSLLICQKTVYHYSHSPQLFFLLAVTNPL